MASTTPSHQTARGTKSLVLHLPANQRLRKGLELLKSYVAEQGWEHVRCTTRIEGFHLGPWVNLRRFEYRRGKLPAWLVQELEAIPGWSWSPREDDQRRMVKLLHGYVSRHGWDQLTHSTVVDGVRLGPWVRGRREAYAAGKLPVWLQTELEKIPGWSDLVTQNTWGMTRKEQAAIAGAAAVCHRLRLGGGGHGDQGERGSHRTFRGEVADGPPARSTGPADCGTTGSHSWLVLGVDLPPGTPPPVLGTAAGLRRRAWLGGVPPKDRFSRFQNWCLVAHPPRGTTARGHWLIGSAWRWKRFPAGGGVCGRSIRLPPTKEGRDPVGHPLLRRWPPWQWVVASDRWAPDPTASVTGIPARPLFPHLPAPAPPCGGEWPLAIGYTENNLPICWTGLRFQISIKLGWLPGSSCREKTTCGREAGWDDVMCAAPG